ncbi:molybdopterin molybdenumtransferase MoeA [Vibrio parahaemolyticus]|uniref:molybdopterin molybdotransferase MoeA n=1 Tax=Vibrio parahaemolyticus TaxID=670 RepID=UPI0006A611CA|nr:molybdopterin molybdotransferase MoeA [Vibrio parahaemolyticus]EGQ8283615.1 molybdopterin molybdotransferase MoeA [Vibrio parahaemolyticus]EGQ8333261.1 molybdopterin molybdotransferase MoeA [Vibrio parahaemolyticus]EJG0031482.1 molybdopterin molybdotransferase MoeA [Vibrio parahaemolyticus]ELB2101121.1 molybdopterin molybdotransferase MoeA [Vibrio parahaemolyticus]KOE18289.1 molybdenum cofactor biosynthesis protein MoaA [Vibrio parahaemolyticus]
MGCCDAPGLMPIEEAMDKMLSRIKSIQTTLSLPLADALGFVLAEDVLSPIHVPPFDNSAMDGYAIRIQDLEASTVLPMVGKSFAGQPFEGEWPTGTCVRIMTGAKIPEGCDAVIMQENTTVTEAGIQFNQTDVKPQNNIRPTGDDIKQGDIVLAKGARLTPRDIPMIASLGVSHVTVVRKPKVAFFSTGDELKPLGEPLEAGQIYDSNRYGIKPLIENFGCEAIDLGIIPDCPETLKATFEKAQTLADVVVTSGGVSVGEADYTKDILEQLGEIGFWKLAIKPGKPFAFGKLSTAWFCGLPGNPVSAVLTMYVLVQPMLAKLAGHTEWKAPESIPATTKTAFKKAPGRTDYQRGIYTLEDGKFVVETTGNQSSGAFRSMSLANCFVVLERERGRVEVGETVQIQLFNSTLY